MLTVTGATKEAGSLASPAARLTTSSLQLAARHGRRASSSARSGSNPGQLGRQSAREPAARRRETSKRARVEPRIAAILGTQKAAEARHSAQILPGRRRRECVMPA